MSFDSIVENSTDAELVDAIDQLHGVMVCTQRQLLRFVLAYASRHGYVDDGARNMAEWLSAHLAEARSDRATVVIHADATFARGGWDGSAELEEGGPLCHSSLDRQLCDCHLEIIVAQPDGGLGIGRKSRSVPRWLERRIRRRDHGCRFPGCGLARWTQIHHMQHWAADQGETNEANLITVCTYHHHFLHEQHWKARGDPNGVLAFVAPSGKVLKTGPPPLRPEILAA